MIAFSNFPGTGQTWTVPSFRYAALSHDCPLLLSVVEDHVVAALGSLKTWEWLGLFMAVAEKGNVRLCYQKPPGLLESRGHYIRCCAVWGGGEAELWPLLRFPIAIHYLAARNPSVFS